MKYTFESDVHTALWGEERWLVSAHARAPGRICHGGGKTLRDVAPAFPLLVKRIDAQRRLSVQVHPNDDTAGRVGGEAKTEMWCVLKPGPIFAGFRPGVTADDVRRAVADGSFETLMMRFDAKPGECYFIPGGLVHAIGEGASVYEVQQSSDTTFRLYDWGRVDADGRARPLHVREALAAMDLTLPPPVPTTSVSCAYFDFYPCGASGTEEGVRDPDSWHVAYEPATDACTLLSPGETWACTTPTWMTRVKRFALASHSHSNSHSN